MKAFAALILSALFVGGTALAQTNAPFTPTNDNPPYVPPPSAPKPHVADVPQPDQPPPTAGTFAGGGEKDPSKVAGYEKRFQEGYTLEQAGKLVEARKIYDGILTDDPHAKGSLLGAGRISFHLGELELADSYLERLRQEVPDEDLENLHERIPNEFPDLLEWLIQINQSLKRNVKVELLIRDYIRLQQSDKVPGLSKKLFFDREFVHTDLQDVEICQFFDPTHAPNTVWMARIFDSTGAMQKRILLNYDDDATRALRARDPKYNATQVFTWLGHQITNGQVTQIDAYLQIFALPDYQKFRTAMFIILANPPKPLYSAPVGPAPH